MMDSLVIGNGEGIRDLVDSLFKTNEESETLSPEEQEEERRRREEEIVLL